MSQDRRTFLRTAGAALSGAALGGCAPADARPDDRPGAGGAPDGPLDPALLSAVGAVVLPSELGDDGRAAAVEAFRAWAAAYEPVAELNHGYGTSEIRYGPPDPVPAWDAQLRALELEAGRRHGSGLAELEAGDRDALVRRALDEAGPGVPSPLEAPHVALALLGHWLDSPDATDRCYGARIAPRTCRGIADAPEEPEGRA